MNAINSGICEVCGKPGDLERTYYKYDLGCECHSPKHFYMIEHHKNCVPKEPQYQKVEFKTSDLKNPIVIALDIVKRIFKDKSEESYYSTCVEKLTKCIMDHYPDSDNNYDKAIAAAKEFLDNL